MRFQNNKTNASNQKERLDSNVLTELKNIREEILKTLESIKNEKLIEEYSTKIVLQIVLVKVFLKLPLFKKEANVFSSISEQKQGVYKKIHDTIQQINFRFSENFSVSLSSLIDLVDFNQNENLFKIDDDLIKRLLLQLQILLDDFSFENAEFGSDVFGIIYETLLEGIDSDNRSAQESSGSYYTPYDVAHEVTEKCLYSYFAGKLEFIQIEDFKNIAKLDQQLSEKEFNQFYETLKSIKILDMAVGSGTFLVASLDVLLELYNELLQIKHTNSKKDVVDTSRNLIDITNRFGLITTIISKNLYGVDLFELPIEICKARLLILLLQSIFKDNKNYETELDFFSFNLKQGNSLIGKSDMKSKLITDFLLPQTNTKQQFRELLDMTAELHKESENTKKEDLKKEFELKKQEAITSYLNYLYEIVRVDLNISNLETVKQLFPFNWILEFPEVFDKEGFDLVLGNPPYNADFSPFEKQLLKKTWLEHESFNTRRVNYNSASLFILRSLKLMNKEAVCGLVVPKSLCYIEGWELIRDIIATNYDVLFVRDLSEAFTNVQLEQISICFGQKTSRDHTEVITAENNVLQKIESLHFNKEIFLITLNKYKIELYNSIISVSKSLGSYVELINGRNLNAHVENECLGECLITLRGRDIERYGVRSNGYINNQSVISSDDLKQCSKASIIVQRIVAHIRKPMDHIKIMSVVKPENMFFVNTLTGLSLLEKNISGYYIMSLLNSSIISWFSYNFIYAGAIRSMDLRGKYLTTIPIIIADEDTQSTIIFLSKILQKNQDILNIEEKEIIINTIDLLFLEIYLGEILNFHISKNVSKLIEAETQDISKILKNLLSLLSSLELKDLISKTENNSLFHGSKIYIPFFNKSK